MGGFDNSANNPRNPDPAAEVRYGQQSWDKMMIGLFVVAVPAETGKPDYFVRQEGQIRAAQLDSADSAL